MTSCNDGTIPLGNAPWDHNSRIMRVRKALRSRTFVGVSFTFECGRPRVAPRNGTVDEHFELAGLLNANLNLGSGVGLVSFGSPAMDNFEALDISTAPPTPFCTSSTTTNGCSPSMTASGSPSASASSGFNLLCTNVEGSKTGLIFYSISGEFPQPWAAGSTSFLCVKTPTQRTPASSTGGSPAQCNGALGLDFAAFMTANPGALGQPISAGQTFHAQTWFRDPPAPKTTNLSNGLRFTLLP